jgi:nucleoside 2-deoxyribosyltransferase
MIFIIHSLNMLDEAIELENTLKIMNGSICYIPGRDTNQNQQGDFILRDNLDAMKACENVVFCIWDGESYGTLADIGSCYALGKTIIPYKLKKVNDKAWTKFFKEKIDSKKNIQYKQEDKDK